jgi:hypothetical protein
MSFSAFSSQPGGVWEFGNLERTRTTRRETSCEPVAETAWKEPLWARAWFDRSTSTSRRPSAIAASPAVLRMEDIPEFGSLEVLLKHPSRTHPTGNPKLRDRIYRIN